MSAKKLLNFVEASVQNKQNTETVSLIQAHSVYFAVLVYQSHAVQY